MRFWTALRRPTLQLTLASGTGQLAALIALPVVSRLFSPTQIGVYAGFNSLATILSVIASLRIDRILPLPQFDRQAARLAISGLAISMLLPGVALLLLVVSSSALGMSLPHLWWIVPILTSAISCSAILLQFCVRMRMYRTVAIRNVLQPSVNAGFQVSGGFILGAHTWVLLLAALVGRAAGLAGMVRTVFRRAELTSLVDLIFDARMLLRRYRSALVFSSMAGLANTASLQIAIPMVGFVFSAHDAGQFAMAHLVLTTPLAILSGAVGQVFLGEFSQLVRSRSMGADSIFSRTSWRLLVLGLVVGAVVYFLAPDAFRIALGGRWHDAGLLGSALAPMLAARLVASPLSHTLVVVERFKTLFGLDLMRLLGFITVFVVASALDYTVFRTIAVYSLWGTTCYALQWIICRTALHRGLRA